MTNFPKKQNKKKKTNLPKKQKKIMTLIKMKKNKLNK